MEILRFVERSLIHHQKLSLNIDFLFEERADDVRASAWNAQLGLAGVHDIYEQIAEKSGRGRPAPHRPRRSTIKVKEWRTARLTQDRGCDVS